MLEALEIRLVPSTDVLSYHNDLGRTGANLSETILTPANVNATNFGMLFSQPVDGQVYASPLYKSNLTIAGMRTFNVAFVATEHDSVYAFDTDSNTSGPSGNGILWQDSFLGKGITPFSTADAFGCGQISPEIGITATPVIDPTTNIMYVVAQTKETIGGTTYHQKLHALDITTGAELFGGPVEITGSVPGTGDSGTVVTFHPRDYKERPGLVLLNGVIYTSWASHCDINPSSTERAHGWVIGYDASTLAQTSVFCTSPNGSLDTIWQGNGALASDGTNLYFETGNGSAGPASGNYDEAFVKLSPVGGLHVVDYFIPFNYQALDAADRDLGSGAPIALPDQPGDHPHLLIGAGKEGRIYVIDRENMGGLNNPPTGPDLIVQELPPNTIAGGSWDTPAYFDSGSDGNRWIYYAGNGDHLKAFSLTGGLLSTSPTSQSAVSFTGSFGATPIVSANGTSDGIVWAVKQGGPAVLYAYDALNLGNELYHGPAVGNSVKFATPTLADGKVFVGTNNAFTIFGLLSPVMGPIQDQTIASAQQVVTVDLSATGALPITFSVTAQSLAYVLTQQTGTLTYDSTMDNFGGLGDKWLQDPSGQWYFILDTGELFLWDGGSGASGTLLGNVGRSYYDDPNLLTNPNPDPHATFSVSGNTLTITRDLAWISSIVVTVTATNSYGSDSTNFNVFVTP